MIELEWNRSSWKRFDEGASGCVFTQTYSKTFLADHT